MCGFISGSSVLFHWSTCLSLYQYNTVFNRYWSILKLEVRDGDYPQNFFYWKQTLYWNFSKDTIQYIANAKDIIYRIRKNILIFKCRNKHLNSQRVWRNTMLEKSRYWILNFTTDPWCQIQHGICTEISTWNRDWDHGIEMVRN